MTKIDIGDKIYSRCSNTIIIIITATASIIMIA